MNPTFLPSPETPGRILVADGSAVALEAMAQELRGRPFTLATAASAGEALEQCAFQVFEAILLDVTLPDLSGFEACRRLRGNELNSQTPVVLLSSAHPGEDWMARGLEAGAMDFLVKPYALHELLGKLQLMVRFSRQQKDLLLAQRQRALFEIAGGAALEVSPYLQDAKGLVEGWRTDGRFPSRQELEELSRSLSEIHRVLNQIQGLRDYVTKIHGGTRVLDLATSTQGTVPLPGRDPA